MDYESMIVVPKVEFETLVSRLNQIETMLQTSISHNSFRDKVIAMAPNGMITAPRIAQLMSWNKTTLWRKIKDHQIPMTKDGNRWKMTADEFITWYETHFLINTK